MMKNNQSIKIYSIGASNEEHGPALPKNIDDFFAKRVAVRVTELVGADYIGHLPYSGDQVGAIAKDWNNAYIEMEEVKENVIKDILRDKERYQTAKARSFSHVVVISGHGGNNFLGRDSEDIAQQIGVPLLYVPPLVGITAQHALHGEIIPAHACDAEHSIALYLGLLDEEKFNELNALAQKSPEDVLIKWPALMGLAGYVLPEFGDKRYDPLRRFCGPEMGRTFLRRKSILADYDVGRQLTEGNIQMAVREIEHFSELRA